jgi:hypothetical protein
MPQLGLGTEIGRVSGGAYDSDALAYFSRAGIASGTQTPSSYDNAASFNGSNQFLSVASNSSLQSGAGDFTFSIWINPSTWNTSGQNHILSKSFVGGGRDTDYNLYQAGGALTFLVGDGTSSFSFASASSLPSTNQWWFIVCGYTSSTKRTFISVNGGTSVIAGSSLAGTPRQNIEPFELGCRASTNYFNGSISSVGFWKRALTASEVTQLFNSGAGRTYASLDSGLRNNLVSWWALNGSSSAVSLTDSHGVVTGTPNNLTNNGSVTAPNIGPIITGYSDSRRLISDFVKGIKSLGLWNSMVCWPLRSSQNVGGGTTAFSLGGLGRFDGTLVNAPVWGDDGVSGFLQNSSRRIETSVGYNFSTQNSIFACARKTAAGDLRLVGQSNETPLFVGSADIRYFNGATAGGTATHPGTNVRSTYSHAFGSSTVVGIVNGGTPVSSAYSPNNLAMQFFIGQGGTNGWVGDISFFAYFSQQIATSTHSQLHSLYRQTLGLGLGLP